MFFNSSSIVFFAALQGADMSRGRKRVRGTTMGEIMLEMSQNADEVNVSNTTTRHIQTQNRLMPESQTHFSKESYLHLLQEYEHSPNTSRKVLEVKNASMRNGKLDMKKKGRGAAKLPDEWDSGVKIQVTLNAEGQVVGVKEQYNKYCSALGALARIGTLLPLNYTSWYHMPKDKLDAVWKDVQANTTLPPEAKNVVLRQLNDMWRDWKRRLKADHFTRYIGDVDHDFSELPNEQVELDQWLVLVQYWKHDEVQKQAVQNAESRAKKKYPHRTGKTPFPLLKEKMQQEGKDTTQLDIFIESRSCGKGIEADQATANLIQEFREGLSKRPESEQTKEFKEDLFVNGLGEDPHGRVRCMGRGITRHKLCEISSHNAPTPQMVEQLQELQRLKDDLIHEKKEVELMRLELDNRKEEFFKEKEQIVDQVRREFRDELDLMKLNMDFLTSLIDPSTIQTTLFRGSKHGQKVGNELIGMPEPQSSTKESAPPQPKSRKSLNFPMPPEQVVAINADNRRNDNDYNCSPVQVGSNVILFCSEIPKEIVAEGTLLSIDPNEKIDELVLGYEFVKVVIRKAIKPDYLLLRPRRGVNTVQDAVGKSVAWEYIDVMEN